MTNLLYIKANFIDLSDLVNKTFCGIHLSTQSFCVVVVVTQLSATLSFGLCFTSMLGRALLRSVVLGHCGAVRSQAISAVQQHKSSAVIQTFRYQVGFVIIILIR